MNDADVMVMYTIDDDGLHVSCFLCGWAAIIPSPASLDVIREAAATHQASQHRSYGMYLGRYVVIEWQPDVEGATAESAAGLLTEIHDEDGETWLTLDWGYAISQDYVTRIAECERTERRGRK